MPDGGVGFKKVEEMIQALYRKERLICPKCKQMFQNEMQSDFKNITETMSKFQSAQVEALDHIRTCGDTHVKRG